MYNNHFMCVMYVCLQASRRSYFMERAGAEGVALLERLQAQGSPGIPWQVREIHMIQNLHY